MSQGKPPASVPPQSQQDFRNAVAHFQAGRMREAGQLLQQVLQSQPDHIQAMNLLAAIAAGGGFRDKAVELLNRAIQLKPDSAEPYANLGKILSELGHHDEAIASVKRAIELDPRQPMVHNNMGVVFRTAGRFDEAVAAFNEAIRLRPDFAEGYANLGNALRFQHKFNEAVACYEKCIQIKPDYPDAHWGLANTLLLLGDFKRGWPEFEWHRRVKGRKSPQFPRPQWNGEPLNGKTIFIHAEQGFGDTIYFARFMEIVQSRGGRIIFACQKELTRLLARYPGIAHVIPPGQEVPPFDLHYPLLSLPVLFQIDFNSTPKTSPYIAPDPEWVAQWKKRFDPNQKSLKIGLAWAGRPTPPWRSVPPQMLASLAQVPGIQFYSLQKKEGAAGESQPPGLRLIDWTADLKDFADTAALIANLDLVITIDTALAHLAGAMGKPTWVMLQYLPDWRWMLERVDNPWYPTMRLFRQPKFRDWGAVVQKIVEALHSVRPAQDA